MVGPRPASDVQSGDVRSPSPTLSPTSTLVDSTPRSPIRHRPTFARLASVLDGSAQRYDAVKGNDEITEAPVSGHEDPSVGLGIWYASDSTQLHNRTYSGSTAHDTSYDPGAGRGSSNASPESGSPYWASQGKAKRSTTSFQSSLQHSFTASTDTQPLRPTRSFAETLKNTYDEFSPSQNCAAHEGFHHRCASWPSLVILIMSVYSTAFSCIYLIIAALGPRYGKTIGSHGHLTSATANLLTAFFAKTIELTFATVYVSFLGQVLWRRAFSRAQKRGVTLAEIDMRSWVMQPGTMLTHFGALRSSILTLLGVLTLFAAIISMLYTTASEALVQPQLKYGRWENKTMQGLVKTSWTNSQYLQQQCASPTNSDLIDGQYGASTCLQIEYASQAFHNYQRYLADWNGEAKNGNGSSALNERPQGFALLFENTTVAGQWIEQTNVANLVDGRIINNISMAMPHAAVTSAAKDKKNGILQPEDLDEIGVYSLHASLWSPAVNVLCANMAAEELEPIVYDMWSNTTLDPASWVSNQVGTIGSEYQNNKTVVDDIFGWASGMQMPPVFPKLPKDYNTILNQTGPYGRAAIYLLGKGEPAVSDYLLCSIKVFQSMRCSTRYNVSSSGAHLEAICNDDSDEMQYVRNIPDAKEGNVTVSKDWVSGAGEWANSIMLDNGLNDANASNARLLTQLILQPKSPEMALNPALPSPAESLAVMAGSTLMQGTLDANILPYWNYVSVDGNILVPGQYETFNTSLLAQQYGSGGNKRYQHGFFVVLTLTFVINVLCLIYYLIYRGVITDYSEPVNLFSLAINSPPSDLMAGSCGGGPQRKQYREKWYVNAAGDHLYMESGAVDAAEDGHEMRSSTNPSGDVYTESTTSPVQRAFRRLSKQTSFL